jgi:two-component system, chemotaxis family, protein-glutamate methylesterase/glutaminase
VQKPGIIVVGASAGGIEALQVLTGGLPASLDASVFVVLHIGTGINGHSHLPAILSRAGKLPAVGPRDGEQIETGKIYVAPPDCHLLLQKGRVHLSHGPKENWTRPAINPLFRSAAVAYGAGVIGVILTGTLDDGVAGLAEIKRRGGVAVVQDPRSAMFSSMPLNAIKSVDVDHVVPLPQIGRFVAELVETERVAAVKEEPMSRTPSNLTCPECRGPLWEERQGRIVEFTCRVGHKYTPLAMEAEHRMTVERSLWSSLVALEEAAEIAEKLAPELSESSPDEGRRYREQAALLKKILERIPSEQ